MTIFHFCLVRLRHWIRSEKILVEKIDSVFKTLDKRLETAVGQIRHLNEQLHEQLARLEILQTRDESHSVSSARGTTAQIFDYYTTTLHSEAEFLATEDIQSEFTFIKDALTKVKLSADFRLCNSWQGIWRSDQSTYNIVSPLSSEV